MLYNVHAIQLFRKPQSHLPSFHPVLHRSSHRLQSNSFFPSFTLTALWASHIHFPNSSLLLTLGAFFSSFIHFWKSFPQYQQGYSFANVPKNDRVSACNCGDGCEGYCAVIECSKVQEARPSCSTSGGQSEGVVSTACTAAVVEDFCAAAPAGAAPFIIDDHCLNAAPELHERHLGA